MFLYLHLPLQLSLLTFSFAHGNINLSLEWKNGGICYSQPLPPNGRFVVAVLRAALLKLVHHHYDITFKFLLTLAIREPCIKGKVSYLTPFCQIVFSCLFGPVRFKNFALKSEEKKNIENLQNYHRPSRRILADKKSSFRKENKFHTSKRSLPMVTYPGSQDVPPLSPPRGSTLSWLRWRDNQKPKSPEQQKATRLVNLGRHGDLNLRSFWTSLFDHKSLGEETMFILPKLIRALF